MQISKCQKGLILNLVSHRLFMQKKTAVGWIFTNIGGKVTSPFPSLFSLYSLLLFPALSIVWKCTSASSNSLLLSIFFILACGDIKGKILWFKFIEVDFLDGFFSLSCHRWWEVISAEPFLYYITKVYTGILESRGVI